MPKALNILALNRDKNVKNPSTFDLSLFRLNVPWKFFYFLIFL